MSEENTPSELWDKYLEGAVLVSSKTFLREQASRLVKLGLHGWQDKHRERYVECRGSLQDQAFGENLSQTMKKISGVSSWHNCEINAARIIFALPRQTMLDHLIANNHSCIYWEDLEPVREKVKRFAESEEKDHLAEHLVSPEIQSQIKMAYRDLRPVLLHGETGTGKSRLARRIHQKQNEYRQLPKSPSAPYESVSYTHLTLPTS
ncbi:MAG: sigma 54-interacting transcriptional regulator, partial [Planctomycetota bacterium]|nr:sigma 54-interacting transcriptional regulator [Planctomycetota bacterium]